MEDRSVFLLDIFYNGNLNKCQYKCYDIDTDEIVIITDKTNYKPYFLAKWLDDDELSFLSQSFAYNGYDSVIKKNLLENKEQEFVKIYGNNPLDIPKLRNNIKYSWEDKIRFHLNHIYDLDLKIGHKYNLSDNKLITNYHNVDIDIVNKFKNDSEEYNSFMVRNLEHFFEPIFKPKFLAIDIEVYSEEGKMVNIEKADKRILSCSFVSNDGLSVCYTNGFDGKHPKTINFPTEKSMIINIFKMIKRYPIIITFNGDNFDLPYIHNRCKNLGIPCHDISIKKGWGYQQKYEAEIKKGIHIDLSNWYRNRSVKGYVYSNKYKRYSLEAISQSILDKGKLQLEEDFSQITKELIDYNILDSQLLIELITYNNYQAWNLMILFTRMSHLPLSDLLRHGISYWEKSILHYEHRINNCLIPNKEDILHKKGGKFSESVIEGKQFKGAIVLEPEAGIHFDVDVFDFASLYPTVIKEYNLSYETINCGHKDCMNNTLRGTPYYSCRKRMGIMAYTVAFFRDIRVKYFKKMAKKNEYFKPVEQGLKVFINASYGVYGSKNFPYFCLPVAESTTAIGRDSIKKTVNKCNELGIKVLYGDTDSVFVSNVSESAEKELIQFSKQELDMDIEKEKTFQILALTERKKNYVGYIAEIDKIDTKGIMGKKRNTPKFIRHKIKEFNEILKTITNMEEFEEKKKSMVKLIKDTTKMVGRPYNFPLKWYSINVQLSKDPDKYIKTTPQHIKAIRKSDKQYKEGDIVEYVKTKDGSAKILEEAKFQDLDIKKYQDLLKSSFEQILDAFGIDWYDVLGIKKIDMYI